MYAAAVIAILQVQDDHNFERSLRDLAPEVARQMREKRATNRERARQEVVAERRHRELVDAIRARRAAP